MEERLSPMEVFLRCSRGESIEPPVSEGVPMEVFLEQCRLAELERLDQLEADLLAARATVKPKRRRPDFHSLRLVIGGRKD